MMATMRSYPTKALLRALLVCVAVCAPVGEALSQSGAPDSAQQAENLFRQGKALYAEGKTDQAYKTLEKAWSLKKSYDVAANLGTVELELKMPRDAAEHFAYALRTFPATGSKKQLAQVKRLFDEARKQVGALVIKVNVEGAEVFIDGKSIGRAPLTDDAYADPGARTIEARFGGYQPAAEIVQVAKGAVHPVALTLTPGAVSAPPPGSASAAGPGASAAPPATGSAIVPPPAPRGASTAVLATGGAAAGGGLVVGLVFTLMSNGKASDAAAKRDELVKAGGARACGASPSPAGCTELHGLLQDRAAFGDVAIVSFVAAGAFGAGTLIYALTATKSPSGMGLQAAPVITGQGGGLTIQGTW